MPRPKGSGNIRITENYYAWFQSRVKEFRAGGRLEEVEEGDLRYRMRILTMQQQRKEGFDDQTGFGGPPTQKEWKHNLTNALDRWCKAAKVTRADLNILNEDQGHLSTPEGKMEAYERGRDFAEETVIIIEKVHNSRTLARNLAGRARVLAIRGHSNHSHHEDVSRWTTSGKKVFVVSDEDASGATIAKTLGHFGAERISLADLEAAAGNPIPTEAIEPDQSWTNQAAPHKSVDDSVRLRLLDLGERAGLRGRPCRVEINSARVAWGEERFAKYVEAAVAAKGGLRVAAPPQTPAGAGEWWD